MAKLKGWLRGNRSSVSRTSSDSLSSSIQTDNATQKVSAHTNVLADGTVGFRIEFAGKPVVSGVFSHQELLDLANGEHLNLDKLRRTAQKE